MRCDGFVQAKASTSIGEQVCLFKWVYCLYSRFSLCGSPRWSIVIQFTVIQPDFTAPSLILNPNIYLGTTAVYVAFTKHL